MYTLSSILAGPSTIIIKINASTVLFLPPQSINNVNNLLLNKCYGKPVSLGHFSVANSLILHRIVFHWQGTKDLYKIMTEVLAKFLFFIYSPFWKLLLEITRRRIDVKKNMTHGKYLMMNRPVYWLLVMLDVPATAVYHTLQYVTFFQ